MKQDQLQTLAAAYRRKETSNLYKVDYRSFCDEVDKVFTLRELEKTPLTLVPAEPYELLDKTRYDFCSKELGNGKDYQVDLLLDNLLQSCRMRGMEVKPFFDEVAQDVVNHVRIPQFKQCLTVGLGFRDLTEQQQSLLVEKYLDDEYGDLVNYAAFARRVDPLA
ncbi:hypothetical protein WJX74_002211 [Apatococcus lobatus]|uniref:Uncharacterized protein n=1 Tax=Apatococcus lobatus TaxID=904363 RepID=A0AAW1S5K3_9CHLO